MEDVASDRPAVHEGSAISSEMMASEHDGDGDGDGGSVDVGVSYVVCVFASRFRIVILLLFSKCRALFLS